MLRLHLGFDGVKWMPNSNTCGTIENTNCKDHHYINFSLRLKFVGLFLSLLIFIIIIILKFKLQSTLTLQTPRYYGHPDKTDSS